MSCSWERNGEALSNVLMQPHISVSNRKYGGLGVFLFAVHVHSYINTVGMYNALHLFNTHLSKPRVFFSEFLLRQESDWSCLQNK